MFAGVRLQQFAEVRTARTQHDLVGGEGALVAGQSHVHKVLLLAQVAERGEDRGLEVVPFQRVLLLGRRRRHGRLHLVSVEVQLVLLLLLQESSGSPTAVRGTALGLVVVVVVVAVLLSRRRSRRMEES